MPTQSTTYNTRLTDEALEKRFRDTFRSQGGAELVDDLYASGVIVPVVDFTAAAEGSDLRADLQTAWDFATGHSTVTAATTSIITTSGFWKLDLNVSISGASARVASVTISDGLTSKVVWELNSPAVGGDLELLQQDSFIIYLRAGDSCSVACSSQTIVDVVYRQVADVSGNLTNPTGFTSS